MMYFVVCFVVVGLVIVIFFVFMVEVKVLRLSWWFIGMMVMVSLFEGINLMIRVLSMMDGLNLSFVVFLLLK